MRLFFGITPEPEVRLCLEKLSHDLQKAEHFTPCRANWIPADRFHLTFLFLGDVREKELPELQNICRDLAENTKLVNVSIAHLGYFPQPKNPKVLWVGLQEKERILKELHTKLCQKCQQIGINTPDHQFLPHVTLARFRNLKGTKAFQNAVKSYRGKTFGSWNINRIELIESRLSQDGPEYKTIKQNEFATQEE